MFSFAVTWINRCVALRNRLFGQLRRARRLSGKDGVASQLSVDSGRHRLDAMFVRPAYGQPRGAVLICHGIAETVELWRPVQELLAAEGVASLVFDYVGYGRSQGRIGATQCEQDAVAAFGCLQALTPALGTTVLGFSMGSGVACAVMDRVPAKSFVLCGAFSSFTAACLRFRVPRRLAPDLWDNVAALRGCTVPVMIVHGERDRLFPSKMARQLAEASGASAGYVSLPTMTHEGVYLCPQPAYWRGIADFVAEAAEPARGQSNQAFTSGIAAFKAADPSATLRDDKKKLRAEEDAAE